MPVTILGPDDPALQALRNVLERHPDWQAELVIIPWAQYRHTLQATLAQPRAAHQSVCVPGHVWLPELVQAGYLAPVRLENLPARVAQAYNRADLLPAVAQEAEFDGQPYMLPLFSDGHILFYRGDLFSFSQDQAVPVISPLALASLAEQAHHPPRQYGLVLKAHPSEILLDWLPFLWECGGDLLDDSGETAFDGEAGVQALQYYCDLRRFCPPDTHTYGNAAIAEAIRSGRVALATTWGGQAAPIFQDHGQPPAHPYRTAVFPRPWNSTWGISIPANQPASIQQKTLLILAQATGPDCDLEVTRIAGSPVRASSYSSGQKDRYPWLAAQQEMLHRRGLLPRYPGLGALLDVLSEAVYAAFTGQVTPQEALAAAKDRLNINRS